MVFYLLGDDLWFPDPHLGEKSGLVAIGGDLSVERLLYAYSNGFFPWFSFRDSEEPYWYCPLDRFVIFPNEIHISHSMRQLIKQNKYIVTFNRDFGSVIRGCSTAGGRNQESGAWLGPRMIDAYTLLHSLGYAVSVEVWEPYENSGKGKIGKLVGGLYGVEMHNAFFGESMFSLVPNASKLALIYLAEKLAKVGGRFIDCQFETPHLISMGGRHITYEAYMKILNTKG